MPWGDNSRAQARELEERANQLLREANALEEEAHRLKGRTRDAADSAERHRQIRAEQARAEKEFSAKMAAFDAKYQVKHDHVKSRSPASPPLRHAFIELSSPDPAAPGIGRIAFLLISSMWVVTYFFVPEIVFRIPDAIRESMGNALVALVVYASCFFLWMITAVAPRCRNAGLPIWVALGAFLPLANLALAVACLAMPPLGKTREQAR